MNGIAGRGGAWSGVRALQNERFDTECDRKATIAAHRVVWLVCVGVREKWNAEDTALSQYSRLQLLHEVVGQIGRAHV